MVAAYEPFLGRDTRTGTWADLARGTYRLAVERAAAGAGDEAARLVEVAILEAEELHDVYGRWPEQVLEWLNGQGVPADRVGGEVDSLRSLLGVEAMDGFEAGWRDYLALSRAAADSCRRGAPEAASAVLAVRDHWQRVHDGAVDKLYGLLDVVVRLLGEERLGDVWTVLMADWYDAHEARLALSAQPWNESRRQLMVAIVDGFHAHLTGVDRLGDVELIEETDRIGFRFAPCGSGGRTLADATTGGHPRPAEPYSFAVTAKKHDWAWNTEGICAYCVHCCLLNEKVPIERLGYPTRVIEPPVWPAARADATCTWWVYKNPALVPDWVYARVGSSPSRRPAPTVDEHPDLGEDATR